MNGRAFFVLSTGRCGTQTLSKLLQGAGNAVVWHHPEPDPITEALAAWHGRLNRVEAFWRFRGPLIRKTWSQDKIHGETDMLMTPFADAIAAEIPQALFVVLVRNPWDFVRSGMRRGYYVDHGWDHGRLCPDEGDPLLETWRTWSPFTKVCWLWQQTYDRIEEMAGQISTHRVLKVRLEDLLSRPEACRELYDFLGLQGYDPERTQQILAVRHNVQVGGDFPTPEHWRSSQLETLWQLCGLTARRWGYLEPGSLADIKRTFSPFKSS